MSRLKKILVADDEAGIRMLLGDALTSVGFKVTLVKDGQESLDQMQGDRFDLLITDIKMPRLDGIELLRRMKSAGRKEKVIVMTGYSEDKTITGADIPPVYTQLQKPFMIHNLLDVVNSALVRPVRKRGKRPDRVKCN